MTKKLLPLLLALVFAFSGCLGIFGDDDELNDQDADKDDDGDGKDGDGKNDDGTDGGGGGNGTTNEAPTASMAANVTAGPAPLHVEFSLDGSDPDEDELTWTLDLGDGSDAVTGSELPAVVEHTFETTGNYTVAFSVDDGQVPTTTDLDMTVQDLPPAPIMHLKGDGSNVIVTDDPDGRIFGMGPETSEEETTYITAGSWNMTFWNSAFVPTFEFDGGVELTGGTVRLTAFVDSTNLLNTQDEICSLRAHLFDGEGESIIAEDSRAFVEPGLGEYLGVVFEFDPIKGEYDGLGLQFGTSGVDCGTFPVEWIWGSEEFPAHLKLADGDLLTA